MHWEVLEINQKKVGCFAEQFVKQCDYEQLRIRLCKMYQIDIDKAELSGFGVGAQTYIVSSGMKKYIVKYFADNEMNHEENEEKICEFMLQNKLPVCQFIKNSKGKIISNDENGQRYHVQKFIEGVIYPYHEAPAWLMSQSAELLGKIHTCLKDYKKLPEGIGQDFFQYRTVEGTLKSYEQTIKTAEDNGNQDIIEQMNSNIHILEKMPKYTFDLKRLTCSNTHGDFNITQLICGQDTIHA